MSAAVPESVVPRQPLRVIVVDDEPLARKRLRSLLGRHVDIEIVRECANGLEAVEAIRADHPDVLFLDVQMPGMSGLEVLDTVGARAVPAVVFVTAFDQHAVGAFEHHALDYLLKPLDDRRFDDTLARVLERLAQHNASAVTDQLLRLLATRQAPAEGRSEPSARSHLSRIVIKSTGKVSFVEVADVDWIEADGDYLRLHVGRTTHLHRATMAELEQQLDPREFVRIHRSTIVRLARVKQLEPYIRGEYVVLLHDGTRLKLSRGYLAQLEAALGESL